MSVPYSWIVYVQLRWPDNSIPTNQQVSQVFASESYGDTMQDLCGAGLEANGICTLHFGRESFYPPRTNPTLTIKVFDCQGALLHTQEFADVINESTLPIIIGGSVSNDWRVSGTVKNSSSAPVTSGLVRAFDAFYTPERLLGEQSISGTGTYEINYTSVTFGKTEGHSAPYLVVRAYDIANAIIAEENRPSPSQDERVDLVVTESTDEWRISGFISLNSAPLISGIVELFDNFDGNEFPLGTVTLNSRGFYLITYLESQFQHGSPRPYPELTVKVYDESNILYNKFTVPSPPSNNQIFNINISGSGESYSVGGAIINTSTTPVQGVHVLLKSLLFVTGTFQESKLGEIDTDSKGKYLITYYPDSIPNRNPGDPVSIFIEAYKEVEEDDESEDSDEKPMEFLGKSPLYSNVGSYTEANLTIDAPSNADISFYTTIRGQLSSAGFTDTVLLQMLNNETSLEYAAKVIGRTRQEVAQVVNALAIKKELDEFLSDQGKSANLVDEMVIYSLIRTGSISSFQGLKTINPKKMHAVLVSAIAQAIIPAQTTNSIADIDDEWEEVYASLLFVATEGSVDAKVLAMGNFPEEVEEIVRTTYAGNAHDLQIYWEELEKNLVTGGFDPVPVIDRLKLIFDVFQFADEFDLLATSIVNYLDALPDPKKITHISGLTSLEKGDWLYNIINPINPDENKGEEWPDEIPGETTEEKKSNYAKILFRRITSLFPMARFRNKLNESTSPSWSHWGEVKTFLTSNPDFDFIDDIKPEQISPPPGDELLGLLQMVQRIFRLTPQFQAIDGLLVRGFTSAISIAHKNGDDFAKDNQDITDGIDDAQTIYTAAVHTASQALFLMGTFNQQSDFDGESLPAVTEKLSPAPAMMAAAPVRAASTRTFKAENSPEDTPETGVKPVYPNIATLFGQQNQCLCPDCQSIFSPSAYMVDLLEFMDGNKNVLFSRRPDLAETELSCRNTNGPVAYIDLVNEQLENAVCTRTFFIEDNDSDDFVKLLAQVLKSELDISEFVREQFSLRGFPIDKSFYIQHKTDENRWYIVGDGWRYLVTEVFGKAPLPAPTFRVVPVPQTGKDAQLRRALPEHTHRNAYALLKNPSFPSIMPFDLSYLEINKLLELRNSRRYRLYHALHERTEPFTLSQEGLRNFFEITPEQFNLIFNASHPRPWELWGLHEQETDFSIPGTDTVIEGTHSWTYLLQNTAVFLNRTGFSYDRLLDLLLTSTVNGDGALFIAGSPDDPTVPPDLETADLSKIWLQKDSVSIRSYATIFTTMARFIRLSQHVNIDLFLLDRVQMLTCNDVPLDNPLQFYKVMRVAEEFKVSPYRVAAWCSARIDNVNLGRGPLCQLEELFISRIESGEQANRWKQLLNNLETDFNIGPFDVGEIQERQGGDIKVLLGGLKLKYDELSLIAHYEFDPSGDLETRDVRAIFEDEDLGVVVSLITLGKMYRAADLSKALGLSIKEYYTLLKYMPASSDDYPPTVFYQMRDAVNKLKKFKLSVYDIDYLLSENGHELITWATTEADETETILKINQQFATFAMLSAEQAQNARESTVIAELSSRGAIAPELTRILLGSWLHSIEDPDISMLKAWVDICSGGWKVTLYDGSNLEISSTYPVTPSINIVSKSPVAYETIPQETRFAEWNTNLYVSEDDRYEFIKQENFSGGVSGTPGTMVIDIIDPATGDPLSPVAENTFEFSKGKLYNVTASWQSDPSTTNDSIIALNLSFSWRKKSDPDAKAVLIGPQNTLFSLSSGLERIVKSAYIVKSCDMTPDQLGYCAANRSELGIFDFNDFPVRNGGSGVIPWLDCSTLFDIFILNRELSFKHNTTTLFGLWQGALKSGGLSSAFVKVIEMETGWPAGDIKAIADHFGFFSADYRKPWAWKILNAAMTMLGRIGISAPFAYSLFEPGVDENVACEALRSSVQTNYSRDEWANTSTKMRDPLRVAQRNALCAHLMSRRVMFAVTDPAQSGFEVVNLIRMLNHTLGSNLTGNSYTASVHSVVNDLRNLHDLDPLDSEQSMDDTTWDLLDERVGYQNTAAIYARYLIDVEMGPEVMTTRIVQANSSIQLLIQRALLNMEKSVLLSDKITKQWQWMKNYRLWEANRKIFLYPENWLEPEFRDDKTPLFKNVESALLQKELDDTSAENAFKVYTSGLSDIANLEVIGAYEEGTGSTNAILHVIGRTYFYPHQFYYRRNHRATASQDHWTPWERVDLDITADVTLPIPFMNKLYLFWPMIELKESMVENQSYKKDDKNNSKYNDSMKYFELKLAWSEYQNSNWSPKRISTDTLVYSIDEIDSELIKPEDLFHFKASIVNNRVQIEVFVYEKIVKDIVVITKRIVEKVKKVLWFKITKTETIEDKSTTSETTKRINRIAKFFVGYDGSTTSYYLLPKEDTFNYLEQPTVPEGITMRHNRAEEVDKTEEKLTSVLGALVYPKGNVLLNQTIEDFKCFPTNLSFLDGSQAPLFYQEKEKSFFLKPVQLNDTTPSFLNKLFKMLHHKNKLVHKIENFYHPLADELSKKANLSSIDNLMTRSSQAYSRSYNLGYVIAGDSQAKHLGNLDFKTHYQPTVNIAGDYPLPNIDFSLDSSYGVYNWELFFHLPLFIAHRLSLEHRYQDALRWYHFIFNPGNDFDTYEESQRWAWSLPKGARFWNFIPFFANRGVLASLYDAVKRDPLPGMDSKLGSLIEDWKNDPFKPHLIARVRVAAYQKSVVMKYLDNLINWGDDLFRLDNMESINEATNLYVYASEILGEKPKLLPSLHDNVGLTYTQMKSEGLDQFSNTFIQMENYIPPAPPLKVRLWRSRGSRSNYYYYHYRYNYSYNQSVESVPQRSIQLLRMAPAMHYFCIPKNERLLSYWRTVDDRLFKIRNSLNIDGIKRTMPLFAPPIDPGLLARAVAGGIDIGTVLRDMQTAPSYYRYSIVYQKAVELCNELKSFGSELLAALEKRDAETLSILRSTHEIAMYKLITDIKKNAVKEAQHSLDGLQKQKDMIAIRYNHYKNIEQYNEFEKAQLATTYTAGIVHTVGQIMVLASAPISVIPDFVVGGMVGMGGGPIVLSKITGGEKISHPINTVGNALVQSAGILDRVSGILGMHGSYKRRSDEWKLQEELAKKELEQVDKQILAAEIRLELTGLELRNHEQQTEQAMEVKEVMESKFTNEKMYLWMSDQLSALYNRFYNLAYAAAKRAERAYQFELGMRSTSFVTPEIWNSAKKGLLAGDNLLFALRQMDNAFIENNKRELELRKTVSLKMIDPAGYARLCEKGNCSFTIPETLFDFDFPGHYFRRIKAVTLTIPCITGPFTTVNAQLKLVSSSIRVSADLINGEYKRKEDGTDDRFEDKPVPPMVIATSSGQSDSGVFELNFRDERYLPFEGAGAISSWILEFPEDFRQFDYSSIADVIITLNYTARESTSADVIEAVKAQCIELLGGAGSLPNFINIRQSFPAQFNALPGGAPITITLDSRHVPFMVADYLKRNDLGSDISVENVKVFVAISADPSVTLPDISLSIKGVSPLSSEAVTDDNRLWELSYDPEALDVKLFGNWELQMDEFEDGITLQDIYLCFNTPEDIEE
jgi:hypothetical protein